MKKSKKLLAVCVLLPLFALIAVMQFRTVASVDGIYLHYQGKVYEECYDVFDFDRGRRLGTVDFGNFRCGLYSLKNHSEYLYVNMGFGPDYRIYELDE